jgi:hypothetical protein
METGAGEEAKNGGVAEGEAEAVGGTVAAVGPSIQDHKP